MGAHRRPLMGADGVHGGVAHCAIGHDEMSAQHTIELGAEPLYRRSALLIKSMGAKLNRDDTPLLKCMGEHHAFDNGVDAVALRRLGIPCGADFDAGVGGIVFDIHVRRHADDFFSAISGLDDGERHHTACVVQSESPFDFSLDRVG